MHTIAGVARSGSTLRRIRPWWLLVVASSAALGVTEAARAQPTPLGVTGNTHDLLTDSTGTVHMIWAGNGWLSYGTIVGTALGDTEEHIAGLTDVTTLFARPRLAVSADGTRVHTAWVHSTAAAASELVHAWREGSGWDSETVWQQPSATDYIAFPAIAVDGIETVHIIAQRWQQGAPATIVHFAKPAGGSWAAAEVIQPADGREWRDCSLVAGPAGGIHGAWKAAGQPGRYRHAPVGEPFEPMEEIPKDGSIQTVSFGDLFVDAAGTVHHAFAAWHAPSSSIEYSVKPLGGSFSAPVSPSDGLTPVDGDDHFPAIGVDLLGRVHVAWAENGPSDDPDDTIKHARLDGSSWARADRATDADVLQHGKVSLAVTNEAVYLLWRGAEQQLMLDAIPIDAPGGAGGSGGGAGGSSAPGGGGGMGGAVGGSGGHTGGSGPAGGSGGTGAPVSNPTADAEEGGCGCRLAAGADRSATATLALLGLLGHRERRRRRRRAP